MPSTNTTSRGRAVRALRGLRGLTQRELARRTDLPLSHLARVERGEADLTPWRLERVLLALDVTARDLAAVERLARRGGSASSTAAPSAWPAYAAGPEDDGEDERYAVEAGVALARALCRRLRPARAAGDRFERFLRDVERGHGS